MYRLLLVLLLLTLLLPGCTSTPEKAIKLGVSQGPHQEIMNVVKNAAATQGVKIEIVPFNNYQDLNLALEHGEIDANSFQTEAYLNNYNVNNQNHLAILTKAFLQPMSMYTKNPIKTGDIPAGAVVIIPNDPINGARALQLIAKTGLIELTPSVQNSATLQDIAANPKQLKFQEIDAALIAQKLANSDFIVCNAIYAEAAHLNETSYRYATEDIASPYTFVIAYRRENTNPLLAQFENLLHSPEVKQYILDNYHGYIMPAW